jgi:hypothetical protein
MVPKIIGINHSGVFIRLHPDAVKYVLWEELLTNTVLFNSFAGNGSSDSITAVTYDRVGKPAIKCLHQLKVR